jgi:HEPN domain-containing protein
MFEPDKEVLLVVGQWVQKAENDLKNAAHTLKLGETGPMDTVCFHAQQCVEKYLKALLILHGIEFSRIHHISALVALLPVRVRPDLTPEEQERLTDYAVSTRYPGDYEPIPLAEARQAVQLARRVRNQIRKWLPKETRRTP